MLMTVGAVMFFISTFIIIFSVIYFGLNKRKYESVVKQYQSQGWPLNPSYQFFSNLGYFGSFFITAHFKKLLAGTPIKTGKRVWLPKAHYEFLQSLPGVETRWLIHYYYINFVWMLLIVISMLVGGVAEITA
ncbi:Uncharacterised protein [Serratia entomophila]|uniref:Uncharacterized protein n=2 Tax=Serratia TaxID=613 RepID=A0A240CDR6_SERFI|nr:MULTISPECIES: hypothetical protein [Serratia]MEE4484021.1 hypothetical protein [Serratia ficaria]REF42942.1 hypothetical protein C7332_1166 [Serratia ficaria]UIW17898.1 hypothetical protein KHA73_21155 [Serratia entomophila]USV00494.1 hypothetical protein KFQ06_21125 [Serratia entomophila]CAI0704928.1 Uncharacterised protein [Serratia entomophila]